MNHDTERVWYDTEGHRTVTEAELREEYESLPADQREAMTFEEYIHMGEAETLRRFSVAASSEIEDGPEDEWDDEPAEGITEEVVEDALWGMLLGEWDVENSLLSGCRVQTFANAGVMTYNKGVVITMPDGSEFQLTIVQSR